MITKLASDDHKSIESALLSLLGSRKIDKSPIKELPKSCCVQSELEVYDFDGYARSLRGKIPATVDGVLADKINSNNWLILFELKSIKKTVREYHFGKCPHGDRGNSPDETISRLQKEYKEFVIQKIEDWNFNDKINGTQKLLTEIYCKLINDIKCHKVIARCFLVLEISNKDFINYRDTFRSVTKKLASAYWGEPAFIPCEKVQDKVAFQQTVSPSNQ